MSHDEQRPTSVDPGTLDAIPGLVRIAAGAWVRTAEWGAVASVRGARRLLQAATDPQSAVELAGQVAQASGVVAELVREVSAGTSLPQAVADVGQAMNGTAPRPHPGRPAGTDGEPPRSRPRGDAARTLRQQGQLLLQQSRDVWREDTGHPAYARILSELAPDEARILVLLLRSGPQPSVDVRTGGPTGMVSSRLLAPGLTMIGPRAGCRYLDQVPSYLHNLFRLGLVWFSREQLRDPMEYQVLEAQPDVVEAVHSVRMAKIVRRSIHLTPFGEDFCRACLVDPGEDLARLPEHGTPGDRLDATRPPGPDAP